MTRKRQKLLKKTTKQNWQKKGANKFGVNCGRKNKKKRPK